MLSITRNNLRLAFIWLNKIFAITRASFSSKLCWRQTHSHTWTKPPPTSNYPSFSSPCNLLSIISHATMATSALPHAPDLHLFPPKPIKRLSLSTHLANYGCVILSTQIISQDPPPVFVCGPSGEGTQRKRRYRAPKKGQTILLLMDLTFDIEMQRHARWGIYAGKISCKGVTESRVCL